MSRESIIAAVIDFLEHKNYKYLKPLGEGGFASVIAVLSPQKEVVAVKIVEKKNVCMVEDQIWPCLRHRNILPVLDVFTMDKPDVKLYITPMLPKVLDETVHSDEFRSDLNGLTKLKSWMNDTLLALDNLHSSGFCHCDLKTDNVLIDDEDRAVLCDFSGLQPSTEPLKYMCSPLGFRPPECFSSVTSENIKGVPYDIYTFGLMALNMLTGHWVQMELIENIDENWTWSSHIWPIMKKALEKPNFEYLMRNSLPSSDISERDIKQALDFILSMVKKRPEKRPSATEVMSHPFLKTVGNLFKSEKENDLLSRGDNLNENNFRKIDDIYLSGNKDDHRQVKTGEPGLDEIMRPQMVTKSYLHPAQKTAVETEFDEVKFIPEENSPKVPSRCPSPPVEQFNVYGADGYHHPWTCLLENVSMEEMKKNKSHYVKKDIKHKMADWFRRKFKKDKRNNILLQFYNDEVSAVL